LQIAAADSRVDMQDQSKLDWKRRLKLAYDAAKGML
jgi:hypothetical protein